jgi:hypothetical protein
MYGMPTPTEVLSLTFTDTCTATVFCAGEDEAADDDAGTVVGLPFAAVVTVDGWPLVLPLEHALSTSEAQAATMRTTPNLRGRELRILGFGTKPP